MGEYAQHGTERIKIGTCSDMYYLRADQRHTVAPVSGSVAPDTVGLRYRFPWPDEDGGEPGSFHEHGFDRSVPIPGATVLEGVEHGLVQFKDTGGAGYLVSLPCPEGEAHPHDLPVHRNGFMGSVRLVRQKLLEDGRLVPVCECGGCGRMYRLEDPREIAELAMRCRAAADGIGRESAHDWWNAVADRILEGARITEEVTA